ncbi:MAG: arylamine N-acetyltransferase [Anaerolineae bacterium]|nr:arylamine N-acetyltransferase [Anaerolineae bacterium]
MNLTEYFDRIGYTQPINPDVDTLNGLQRAHMQTVPFENLDIGLKRPIRIDEKSIWDKLIDQRRGGFCYELNGLFAWLLKQIGYQVPHLNARVFNRDGNLGIDFDHLALLVQVPGGPGRWLADVGFGDSFIEPLSFDTKDEQTQGLRAYRLEQTADGFIVWQKNYDGTWERQYFFDLEPHRFPDEYESACLYHQTSPRSSFTRGSIISRATPDGRVSLEDGRLIVTRNGQRTERLLDSQDEYRALLKEHFGITL